MTTFQDPPPHSRRAVRQSERDETPPQAPVTGAPYTFDTASSVPQAPQAPQAPQTGRRAQQAPVAPSAPVSGDQQPPTGFEPLTYSTQGRVAPPADERIQQQPLAAAPPPVAPEQSNFRVRDFSPEGGRRAAPPREQAQNPLSNASSFPAPASTASASPTSAVDLDYHTQGVPQAPSHSAAPQPLDDALNHTLSRRELREMRAAEEQQAPALQLPESIDTLLNSGPIEIPTLAPPPGQSQALAEAMAEFDLLTRSRREAEARARDAQVASLATPIIPTPTIPTQVAAVAPAPVVALPVVAPPAVGLPVQAAPVQAAPVQAAPVQPVSVPSVPAPTVSPVTRVPSSPVPISAVPISPTPISPTPISPTPISPAPVSSVPVPAAADSPAPIPSETVPPLDVVPSAPLSLVAQPSVPQSSVPQSSVPQPPVLTTPVFADPSALTSSIPDADQDEHGGRSPRASNHWRVQAALEDDELPYENTLSRTVGSNTSAITTSALVLPSVPQPDSMLASLNATGEILVTGSINLPRSLGATGAHPDRVDHADDEDDPFDSQVVAPDSAPVRAIRAISSNTSTRAVIETKRPQGNRMLTGVIIAASVLCVGLVGLLVFAFATGKL
jgi:hypothetical protein